MHVGVVNRGFLPLAPLWRVSHCSTADQLAEQVGVSRRQIGRWKRDGIPVNSADRVACALGSHPSVIWGSQWEEAG